MTTPSKKELEKFELGTVCNYAGLAFLTLIPMMANSIGIIIEPATYKFFALFFLFFTGIFFLGSPSFYKTQLIIIGANFLVYSFFQILMLTKNGFLSSPSALASIAIGIGLIIYAKFFSN